MKVLYVVYDRPEHLMGPTVNATRLLPRLRAAGVDATALVLHTGSHAPVVETLKDSGVPVHVEPRRRYVRQQIRWYLDRVPRFAPDVFVPNLSVAGWCASRYLRPAGIPTVAAYRREDAFYEAMLDRFVFGDRRDAVSGVMAVSRGVHERIERRLGHPDPTGNGAAETSRTRSAWIPSGVPVPPKPTSRRDPFTLLALGRLERYAKRIDRVVDAMIAVIRRYPRVRARIVGDGSCEAEVRERIEGSGVAASFDVVGRVGPDRLDAAITGASVIIQLSELEGTPAALMDAMAAGVVPIARHCSGGVDDLIDDDVQGRLLPGNIDGAAERDAVTAAVGQYLDRPELWQRHAAAARRRVVDTFSVDEMTRRWVRLLDEVSAAEPDRDAVTRRVAQPWTIPLPPRNPAFAHEDRRRKWMKRLMATRSVVAFDAGAGQSSRAGQSSQMGQSSQSDRAGQAA